MLNQELMPLSQFLIILAGEKVNVPSNLNHADLKAHCENTGKIHSQGTNGKT